MRFLSTRVLLLILGTTALPGCEADAYKVGHIVPVEGRILVNGKPLRLGDRTFGRVWFYPDAAKGNTCPQVATGDIDGEGRYRLTMRGREGVPPGWYKVMVVAVEQIDAAKPARRRQSFVPPRYGAVETSGLCVQAVAEPATGAYDLRLRQ
jgi:hypothetical protein